MPRPASPLRRLAAFVVACLALWLQATEAPANVPPRQSAEFSTTTHRYDATSTSVVFSGGTSVQEYNGGSLAVEHIRGPDMGGGVGGLLYTLRGGAPSFAHSNRRGDVTARTDASGSITWQASYEAFGTRPAETGSTPDRQKANTKDEDPTGLLNEGFRYRDLETGVWLTPDPAGFVDGPNLYAYVRQNPWTSFDPNGLSTWSNIWKGDFDSEETTWGGIGGQVVVGFIPVVGQIADVRDTAANIKNVWNDPGNGAAWAGLGGAAVAWIPGVGDAAKGIYKGGKKAVVEGAQQIATHSDEVAGQTAKQISESNILKNTTGGEGMDVAESGGKNFDQARREAFEKAGMTDPSKVQFTHVDPKTGTVVGFKGEGGAKVVYDGPHPDTPGPFHDVPHVGLQMPGKVKDGGRARENIPYEGPQHPSRSPGDEVEAH